jgi:hypothetical protein
MAGPGAELKRIIPSILRYSGCSCNDYAKKMDSWGVDGCETRFDEIVNYLVEQATRHPYARILPQKMTKHQAEVWLRKAIDNSREKQGGVSGRQS